MLDFLAQSGIRLMVSLDGGPSAHDRVRVRRDGRGTHAAVIGTVERALSRGLRPNVSITLTALTLDGAEEAVAFALERELPFNLNFYRQCTIAEDAPSPLIPAPERLVECLLQVFELIRLCPAYPLPLTGILDRTRVDIPHDRPCSAGRDYLAIGTAGQVSACQMLLAEPWADLADVDPLTAVRRCGERLFNSVAEGSDCRACPWRTACGGGCPLLRDTALHSQYCQAYRLLLPQVVRLEASRLIATQRAPSVYYH
jgi:radical SAM protein with 4Fe4S-binding SPASM domain